MKLKIKHSNILVQIHKSKEFMLSLILNLYLLLILCILMAKLFSIERADKSIGSIT